MDKQKSILNISISIFSKLLLLLAALSVRRLLIQLIGNDVNGLNSLYTSIIGMLSVAELGVGSAIVFSMYHPIVVGDKRKVSALYCLYKKLYRIIGVVIFVLGLGVMFFLPLLINDYHNITVDVHVTFFLVLISVIISYCYSAKTSLIEAYKDNYLTIVIFTVSRLVRYGLQIAVILIWKSFTIFLICQIIETLLIWGLTELAVRRKHGELIKMHEEVDSETKIEIIRNIKALFMHKIGTIMVNTMDSIIISVFIGVLILGKYSNYILIASVISGTISLFFTPLTSVVGHLCAKGNSDKTKNYFDKFYSLNYILGMVFFLGYYAVIDNVVSLCFGPGLEISRAVIFIITLNQFIHYMRNATLLFRDASGAFYYDRWKPIVEGVSNLILSLLFVNIFPVEYRIVGVVAATIVTSLLIVYTIEPYVVFHYVFKQSPKHFYFKSYNYVLLFTLCLLIMTFLMQSCKDDIFSVILNGFISVVLSIVALCFVATIDKTFRKGFYSISRKVFSPFVD